MLRHPIFFNFISKFFNLGIKVFVITFLKLRNILGKRRDNVIPKSSSNCLMRDIDIDTFSKWIDEKSPVLNICLPVLRILLLLSLVSFTLALLFFYLIGFRFFRSLWFLLTFIEVIGFRGFARNF